MCGVIGDYKYLVDRGVTRLCGAQGKKQNGALHFFFTYFYQKVDLLKICATKSDKRKNNKQQTN